MLEIALTIVWAATCVGIGFILGRAARRMFGKQRR